LEISAQLKLRGMNKYIFRTLSVCLSAAISASIAYSAEVSRWQFDGNAIDSVGNRNGTLLGDAKYSNNVPPGKSGMSLQLDGTLDKMIYDVPSGDSLTGNFTVAAWVYLAADRPNGTLTWFGTRSPDQFGFDFKARLANNNAIRLDLGDGSSGFVISDTSVGLGTNVWHHVAVAVQPNQYDLYVDGALANHAAFATFVPVLWDANHDIAIGAVSALATPNGPPDGEDFNGLIDDVRVFNTALTAPEIRALIPEPQTLVLAVCGLFAMGCHVATRRFFLAC
jgi:hypothetical protein